MSKARANKPVDKDQARVPAENDPYDPAKIDAAVLALLHLNSWTERIGRRGSPLTATLAWKSLNWDALDRLHAAELISNPRSKAKSLGLTPEGVERAAEACRALFGREAGGS